MGVDPFLSASAVRCIVAQRLVRKICPECKEQIDPQSHEMLPFLNLSKSEIDTLTVFQGKGCTHCNNTGYKGRCGLYEVLPITQAIQDLIITKAPPFSIQSKALEEGMLTLRMVGMQKLMAGETSISEVVGATS